MAKVGPEPAYPGDLLAGPTAVVAGTITAASDAFELVNEGGQDKVQVHGAMGATETIDPTDGNVHMGTLSADCTVTLAAPPATRGGVTSAATIEFWVTQDSTGNWSLTMTASGGVFTWDGGSAPTPSLVAGTLVRYIFERVPATTNDWIGNLVGGASSSASSSSSGSSGDHVHAIGEPFIGNAAATVFYLANEAELDTVAAYDVNGHRAAITQDSTELDKVTFSVAPAAGQGWFDYVAATD